MWLESVLGICVGCEIHGFLVRRGLTTKDEAYEICAGGACEIPVREEPRPVQVQEEPRPARPLVAASPTD